MRFLTSMRRLALAALVFQFPCHEHSILINLAALAYAQDMQWPACAIINASSHAQLQFANASVTR